MKIEDLITLAKAGFTKDEIIRLASGESSSTPAPQQPDALSAPAEKAEPAKEEAPKEAPAEDIGAIVSQKISEAFKPFEDLYNNIAVKANMPTIGNIQPKGMDDIVDSFFK